MALPAAFLLALGGILLEIAYGRILSFKLVDPFPLIVFAIALFGVGAGAVLVASIERLREARIDSAIPAFCLLAAFAVLAGYPAVARIGLDTSDIAEAIAAGRPGLARGEWIDLALLGGALVAPFLAVGMAVATLLGRHPRRVRQVYGVWLVGAAAGSAVAVPLLSRVHPPGVVMVAGACFAAAAMPFAALRSRVLVVPVGLAALVLAGLAAVPGVLPDPTPDRAKGPPAVHGARPGVVFSGWSPLARTEVSVSDDPDRFILLEDGSAAAEVGAAASGEPAAGLRWAGSDRGIALRVRGGTPDVLVLRASGDGEVRAALELGAKSVTVVEPDPLRLGVQAGAIGSRGRAIGRDPRVRLVNGDGRAIVRSEGRRYDVIWVVLRDGDAALRAVPEANLPAQRGPVTVEAIIDGLEHLAADGVLAIQIGDDARKRRSRRLLRFVATVREALESIGVPRPADCMLVAVGPGHAARSTMGTILVRPAPFLPAEVERFTAAIAGIGGARVLHAPGAKEPGDEVSRLLRLTAAERSDWLDGQSESLAPVHDDAPFFGHFTRFRDVLLGRSRNVPVEEGIAEILLPAFLVVAVALAGLLLLSPLARARAEWRLVPGKLASATYFAAIGAGFMLVEIGLINEFNQLLGYPTHAISVTLCALLLSSGLGSLVIGRLTGIRGRALAVVGALVFTGVVACIALGVPALGLLDAAPLAVRVAVVVLFVLPLGLALGVLLPIGLEGLASVAPERGDVIAWGWAVNGFASVVSSVGAVLLAMTFGFAATLLLAVVVYWVGIAALMRTPDPPAGVPGDAEGRPRKPQRAPSSSSSAESTARLRPTAAA